MVMHTYQNKKCMKSTGNNSVVVYFCYVSVVVIETSL